MQTNLQRKIAHERALEGWCLLKETFHKCAVRPYPPVEQHQKIEYTPCLNCNTPCKSLTNQRCATQITIISSD
jgi:hypothetical protein